MAGVSHRLLLVAGILALPATAAAQTELTLTDALARAERHAFANRVAAGETAARAGEALAPLRGILPTVRMEGSYLRTTDPLNAFGFVLRQRSVTPAAFAPSQLNDPDPTGNLTTGLVLEQPLFNADAWLGRRAAGAALDAARAAEDWSRSGTALDVVRAYWGAVLAGEQVRTLAVADQSARAHLSQAEALVRQGMATRSDALLAEVRTGEIEADLLSARNAAVQARRQLAVLLGEPGDTLFTLPDSIRAPSAAAVDPGPDSASGERSDVRAARLALSATQADARRAQSLYLPRVNGFGRLDWNTPDRPFAGQTGWTFGVMLTWSPFAGASELAESRAAAGRRSAAEARAEAAAANAVLEQSAAEDAYRVAQARLAIAERAVAQAEEAHRIVSRKYDGGLATVSELLTAAAVETGARLNASNGRYQALIAQAALRRARGERVAE